MTEPLTQDEFLEWHAENQESWEAETFGRYVILEHHARHNVSNGHSVIADTGWVPLLILWQYRAIVFAPVDEVMDR